MHSIGYLFKEGLKSLWKNRTMSIASVAVLISCLLMTGIAGLLSVNLSMTMKSIEGNNSITVYLEDGLPSLTAVKVGEEIKKIDNISECTLVTKDEGLERMMRDMDGSTDLFNGLLGDENPLPDAYIISMVDLSLYDQTMEQVRNINGVSKASDFRDIATKLSNLDRLVRYCSIGIVLAQYRFAVYHCEYGKGDYVFPQDGNQHHEIGGRYQRICTNSIYSRRNCHRYIVRGYLSNSALFCL